MIKLGCFAVLRDDGGSDFLQHEEFISFAHEFGLDVVDFHLRKGFESYEPEYLLRLKILCQKCGLPIGYLGSGGSFVGSAAELRVRVELA